MKDYIEERAVEIANYIIETRATVRQTAKKFGISKSTVHTVVIKCEFFVCFALKQKRSRKNLPNSLILRAFCLIFSWKCGTVLV